MANPGVDTLPGRFVPQLSVVGVVRFSAPPTAHVYKEAMSFVLISGISSYSVGSGLSAGGITMSGLVVENGTGVGAGIGAGSGWTSVG